jgi:hypothetical protein
MTKPNDKRMTKPNEKNMTKNMTKLNIQQPSEFAGKIFTRVKQCKAPKF